ncbi:enoyl-CoA hydratase [soil metagenome]
MASLTLELPARARSSVDEPGDILPGVVLVTIERPEVLNALDRATMTELAATLERLDLDESCRAIVITVSCEHAVAAVADILEMVGLSPDDVLASDLFAAWDRVAGVETPTIAAVRGFALGGGCELAMACDVVIAGEDAVFGQPEVALGVIPGVGGTQRLTRVVGKATAMELVLSGRRMSAPEALACGLVARVVAPDQVAQAALELAAEIAGRAPLAVRAAKRAVALAFELPLAEGIAAERRLFAELFATQDQTEGMTAFLEKRPPTWKGG